MATHICELYKFTWMSSCMSCAHTSPVGTPLSLHTPGAQHPFPRLTPVCAVLSKDSRSFLGKMRNPVLSGEQEGFLNKSHASPGRGRTLGGRKQFKIPLPLWHLFPCVLLEMSLSFSGPQFLFL